MVLGKTTNPQFLEIVSGVNEGDRILADPKHVDPLLVDLSEVPLVEPSALVAGSEVASLIELNSLPFNKEQPFLGWFASPGLRPWLQSICCAGIVHFEVAALTLP